MTDTMTVTAVKLDKTMLAAFLKADRIVFRHTPGKGSQIEAIKENRPSEKDPFAQDVVVTVPCMFAVDDYGGGGSEEYPAPPKAFDWDACRSGNFHGFEMEHTPRSAHPWQTAVKSMRAGDVLGLRWQRNAGTNPAIYKLGVVSDTLSLWIERGDRSGGVFILSTHAVPASAEGSRIVKTRPY